MSYKVERTLKKNGQTSIVLVDSEYKTIEEVALFLNYLEMKGGAINTIESYCYCLKVFYEWLYEKDINFYEVSKRDMISLIEFIKLNNNTEKSGRTINKYLASITSFYRYFEGIGGYIDDNPLTIKRRTEGKHFIIIR